MTLTLQKCESYLFDSKMMHHRASLSGLSLNSDELCPSKFSEQLQLYTLKDDKLIHKGTLKNGFKHIIKLKRLDPARCFVIELNTDPFTKSTGTFQYLIHLDAPFIEWDKALVVKKDETTQQFSIEQTSENSEFLTITYFRRFAAMFPDFLISEGVQGVFPVIAQKSL